MPAGVSNGNGIKEPRRTQAVELIARGCSLSQIEAQLGLSPGTVIALKSAEFDRIEARKSILCAQAAQIATAAADQLQDALHKRKVPVGSLPTVFGIAVDKVNVLSADPTANIQQHLHLHLQANNVTDQFNQLLARLEEKCAQSDPTELVIDDTDASEIARGPREKDAPGKGAT
jgi:hypothetical protein